MFSVGGNLAAQIPLGCEKDASIRMGRSNRFHEKIPRESMKKQQNMVKVPRYSRRRAAAIPVASSSVLSGVDNDVCETATAEAMFTSPSTTKSRVKSQERTPTGQQISMPKTICDPGLREMDKKSNIVETKETFTDVNSNSISNTIDVVNASHKDRSNKEIRKVSKPTEITSNSVSPAGRNLLKQLQSSLSPKLTEMNIHEDRRVSRYGRHQKQKENLNYVPVELMKFVTKSPAKVKSKKNLIKVEIEPEQLSNEESRLVPTSELEGMEINLKKTELKKSPSKDIESVVMLPTLDDHADRLLCMDAINLVGMDVSFENIDDENMFTGDLFRKQQIDHIGSGEGYSIGEAEYREGEIYWAAQTQRTIHWPCIVRVDPETHHITRKRPDNTREIHVSFFGDRGRRGWIREAYMAPFNGMENYCNRVENYEFGKFVKSALKLARRQSWKNASQQAETFNCIEIGERLEQFDLQVKLDRIRVISKRVTKADNKSNRKRERSATPESPTYDALPTPSENVSKKMRLQQKEESQSQNGTSTIVNQSEEEADHSMNVSFSEDSKCYTELVYKLIVNIGRKFLLNDQKNDEHVELLQQYARKISMLKNDSDHHRRKRTIVLRELCQLRKLCQMLDEFMTDKNGRVDDSPVMRMKKEKQTLEEEFIFELDPKIIMKGVPKGVVCYICERPQNVVKCTNCQRHIHLMCVTTNPIEQVKLQTLVDNRLFNCAECTEADGKLVATTQTCFVCRDKLAETRSESKYRCMSSSCSRQYHPSCLRLFPQFAVLNTQHIICPYHVCHTCVADDPGGKASTAKATLIRCIKCPSSYHPDLNCIPAGSEVLTTQQLICPKHSLDQKALNVNWCFLCCKGGDLICCETCPNALHRECLPFSLPEGKYFCEECESGRLPLYNEIVIAKLGNFRWWPALIIPPSEISKNLLQLRPGASSICVKFFQSRTVAWLNRSRMYLYQLDDSENLGAKKAGSLDKKYRNAMAEASRIYHTMQMIKSSQNAQVVRKLATPPPIYQKIKTNRYVAPLKQPQSSADSNCYCRPDDEDPCGPTSSCINRAIMIECIPKTCPAKERCSNQRFAKRLYPSVEVHHFAEKGYGLVAKEEIEHGRFIIEYVGEVINTDEFHRRICAIQERQMKNYYFLTVEPDMTIDAGTKGNVSRFINHSCDPNCETQKWSIGNARVIGLFAIKNIKAGEELTFNYNLESLGNKKRVCLCGATKCSGFIGEKYRPLQVPPPAIRKPSRQGPVKKRGTKTARQQIHIQTKSRRNVRDDNERSPHDKGVKIEPKIEPETNDFDYSDTNNLPLTIDAIKKEKVDYDSQAAAAQDIVS